MNKTAKEFEVDIKALSNDFQVVDNVNRPGLTNILYQGKNFDLPVISTNCIKTEVDRDYRYEFPNGASARYWTQEEILNRLKDFLGKFETIKEEYAD
jgi:hypothetical protein